MAGLYFLNPDVCMLKNECLLFINVMVFFNEIILKPFMKICVQYLALAEI